jgi:hypothetical protein
VSGHSSEESGVPRGEDTSDARTHPKAYSVLF